MVNRSRTTVLVVVAALAVTGHAFAEEKPYDPWRGMDRDGRIPAAAKPPTLEHPERWRYIPEGRIKPGNILQRFLVSSFVAPFFFRDTDVGFGGGLAITDIDFREQRRREFAGIFVSRSQEGQQAYTLVWRRALHHIELPDGGVLQEERSAIKASVGYRRTLTRRFFGFGDDTSEGDETSYTDETAFGGLGLDLALPEAGSDWVLNLGVRGEWHNLGPGRVDDVPVTGRRFPLPYHDANDTVLGWLETGIRWDTRDAQRLAYRGTLVALNVDTAPAQRGGDVGALFSLTANHHVPLPPLFHDGGDAGEEHPPTDSLALSVTTEAVGGDLPFFALPSLGGATYGRGFIEGRFRDRNLWAGSVEYRFWVVPRGFPITPWTPTLRIERLGMALFYDAGSVEDDWTDLATATVRHTFGIGFRATLERLAPFRVDVGFSEDGVQTNAGFGLNF